MCRWLAYCGPAIYLDALIFAPSNSLASQSLAAQQSKWPTNGDGFGVGWYGSRNEPGLFRDVLPAWNDSNLRCVAEQVRSSLFFAHVRASTGTSTSRANCHPFRHGRRLFMHNGQIGGFEAVRRALMLQVDPTLFPGIQGNTDSELFFYLLLGNDVDTDPHGAFARTVGTVLEAMQAAGVKEPFRMSAAFSDGHSIHAVRYASDDLAPTLYHGCDASLTGHEAVLVLSEPVGENTTGWAPVPQSSFVSVAGNSVRVKDFQPRAGA